MSPPPERPCEDIGGFNASLRGTLVMRRNSWSDQRMRSGGASGCAAIRPRRTGTMGTLQRGHGRGVPPQSASRQLSARCGPRRCWRRCWTICRHRTEHMRNGRGPASSTGAPRSAPIPAPWSSMCNARKRSGNDGLSGGFQDEPGDLVGMGDQREMA